MDEPINIGGFMVYKNRTKFQKWAIQHSRELTLHLKISYPAIHQWYSGKTTPKLEHAVMIERLSERFITLADIYPDAYKND